MTTFHSIFTEIYHTDRLRVRPYIHTTVTTFRIRTCQIDIIDAMVIRTPIYHIIQTGICTKFSPTITTNTYAEITFFAHRNCIRLYCILRCGNICNFAPYCSIGTFEFQIMNRRIRFPRYH